MFYLDGSSPDFLAHKGNPVPRQDSPCGQYISKEETIWLCHPERSEGSLFSERSFAPLRMTLLNRLRLTRKTSYVKCIAPCGQGSPGTSIQDNSQTLA